MNEPKDRSKLNIVGHVKVQSMVFPFGKQLVPQFLYIGDKVWRPCSLLPAIVSKITKTRTVARIGFESEMNQPCWINIDTMRHRLIRRYDDGSTLYECEIEDAEILSSESSFQHHEYRLRLFHHTKSETVPMIFSSGELRSSSSNYEGSHHHEARSYIYFTDIESLTTPDDLSRVAMSDEGKMIGLEYDQPEYGVEILKVPERSMGEMDASIEVLVEPDLIDTQPMLYHDQRIRFEGDSLYWELMHKNIFRIPVEPGGAIFIKEQRQVITAANVRELHMPDSILAGCAFSKGKIRIVFDEVYNAGYQVKHVARTHDNPLEAFLSS
ncbi:MAG: hypothetical protein AB2563_11515 [Candidatus Thiodiazotropha endolucinida]